MSAKKVKEIPVCITAERAITLSSITDTMNNIQDKVGNVEALTMKAEAMPTSAGKHKWYVSVQSGSNTATIVVFFYGPGNGAKTYVKVNNGISPSTLRRLVKGMTTSYNGFDHYDGLSDPEDDIWSD